ncbi:MAG TPA: biotin/lipoyl-containing protein [Candidatus Limnocylindria bacterium]|jgi:3-methylcrotonyl-CoA carboxylase alpha subunit
MSDLELRIADRPVDLAEGWTLTWLDREHGVVLLRDGRESKLALAEGVGADWVVTLDGRRIAVTATTWRERVLAEADVAARTHAGPTEVRATLPGLVVAVAAVRGAAVGEGEALVTIEAMKMQNEVRAPRAGRVATVAVSPGQPVASGALLVLLE